MSKPYTTINVDNQHNTAWITLNRPNKLNAINHVMLDELSETLDKIEADTSINCVIITGNGKKAFSTGADLMELQKLTPETAAEFSRKGQQVFSKIESLSKPVVAAINGYALGGGLELVLACDFRITVDYAEFGCPEIKLGILPAWGGTQRLPLTVGEVNAKRLIMLGNRVSAQEALSMGLVDKVVKHSKLKKEVEEYTQRVIESPSTALKYVKHAVTSTTRISFESGLKKETEIFVTLFATKHTKQQIESFKSRETKK